MDMLTGRAAIVTGGAQGIGRAIVARFLSDGLDVLAVDSDEEAGRELTEEVKGKGKLIFLRGDVALEEDAARAAKAAAEEFGGIDILVNNAGIFTGEQTPLEEFTLETWRRVLDVNLTSVFLFSKHAAPHLRRRHGSIVNIASTRAFMSEPNTFAYSATKGGIVALTHELAVSLGPDVRVNCISPGWIETSAWKKSSQRHEPQLREIDHKQHPAGRVGTPEDIASAVVFLVMPENGFITGANLVIDGGMTRKMIYA